MQPIKDLEKFRNQFYNNLAGSLSTVYGYQIYRPKTVYVEGCKTQIPGLTMLINPIKVTNGDDYLYITFANDQCYISRYDVEKRCYTDMRNLYMQFCSNQTEFQMDIIANLITVFQNMKKWSGKE